MLHFAPYPSPPLNILQEKERIRHILVTRTDHLGDMILSIPFFRALHKCLPQAEVALMALSPYTAEALKELPYVHRYYYHTYNDMAKHRQTLREIREWGVDLAVGLAAQSLDYKTCAYSGAPLRVAGVRVERFLRLTLSRLWLTHIMPCWFKAPGPGQDRVLHEVERTSQLARFMGLECDDMSLELGFSSDDEEWAERFQAVWGQPVILMHIQERLLTDRAQDTADTVWNCGDVAELVKEVIACARGGKVAITYGPYEERAQIIAGVRQALADKGVKPYMLDCSRPLPEKIEDDLLMIGNLPLKRWAKVIGMASCVFSPDTGAVHVAAAMHRPVVGLYLPKKFSYLTQHVAPWQIPCSIIKKSQPQPTAAEISQALEAHLWGK